MTQPRGHAILTFRISSLLLIIMIVAVCLAGWQAQPYLGIGMAAAALPALGYTCVVAFKKAAAGSPMLVSEKTRTFCDALLGVVAIAFAAFVAFCMTCFPSGYLAVSAGAGPMSIFAAFAIGGLAALVAGGWVTYFLLTRKRRLARKVEKR